MPEPTNAVIEALCKEMLEQSLDLTLRNPLLKLPDLQRSARFIPLGTDDADLVLKALLEDERSIRFVPSDANSFQIQHAKETRLQRNEELRLVTSLDEKRLLARQRSIRKTNEELIEKRGLPCGYIAYGALSWTSIDEQKCAAPLLLIPVDVAEVVDRNTRQFSLQLRLSDRDVVANPVLRPYLKKHFKLDFPDISKFRKTDEPIQVGHVEEWKLDFKPLLRQKPEWKIESFIALGLFDSGAIPIDCTSDQWDKPLGQSPVLKTILLNTHVGTETPTSTEFLPNHLVLEADGSQLQVLKRVGHGESVVIHGPPGSGKSQTIVNVIAAALARQKSVLFVAQKPEAALVVHRRMREVGLESLCAMLLPLDGRNNLRTSFLEGLRKRDALPRISAQLRQLDRNRLRQAVEEFDKLAAALRRNIPALERSARTLVAEAVALQAKGIQPVPPEKVILPGSPEAFASAQRRAEVLSVTHAAIPKAAFDALIGLSSKSGRQDPNEAGQTFSRSLTTLSASIATISDCVHKLSELTRLAIPNSPQELSRWIHDAPPLNQLEDASLRANLRKLLTARGIPTLTEFVRQKHRARELTSRYSKAEFISSQLIDCSDAEWNKYVRDLQSLAAIADRVSELRFIAKQFSGLQAFLESTCELSSPQLALAMGAAQEFAQWKRRTQIIAYLGRNDARKDRAHQVFAARRPTLNQLQALQSATEEFDRILAQTENVRSSNAVVPKNELIRLRSELSLATSGLSHVVRRIFSVRYRRAAARVKSLLLPHVSRAEWPLALNHLVELAERAAALQSRQAETMTHDADRLSSDDVKDLVTWIASAMEPAPAADLRVDDIWALLQESTTAPHNSVFTRLAALSRNLPIESPVMRIASEAWQHEHLTPREFIDRMQPVQDAVGQVLRQADALGVSDSNKISSLIESCNAARQLRKLDQICRSNQAFRELFGAAFHGLASNEEPLLEARRWIESYKIDTGSDWQPHILWLLEHSEVADSRIANLRSRIAELGPPLDQAIQSINALTGSFVWSHGAAELAPDISFPLQKIAQRCNSIKPLLEYVPSLLHLAGQLERVSESCGIGVVERVINGTISGANLLDCYRLSVFEAALRTEPALQPIIDFNRVEIDVALETIHTLDKELRKNNAAGVRAEAVNVDIPAGISSGPVREKTELGLIRHQLGLQKPRCDLHSLYGRAGSALRALQPCTIATPTTVSEYLPRIQGSFDLVIIDEASQVLPAAAIGTIARGKQVVIVGDPKQLPPTTFFMTEAESDGDEDCAELGNTKAILDKAIGALANVHLRGHYRSKHHSLIDFSNRQFYDRSLIVTPSTLPRSQTLGVVSHHVEGATYSVGENEVEAKAVAKAVIRHLCEHPMESLGVVAFNVRQAALIESHIEALAQDSQSVFELYVKARASDAPLFVRSLESVQGDERDVIFISYTYGREVAGGPVAQRFGPINLEGGERRLNVLVTRAKLRVEVFHSILPADITSPSEGAKVMRAYLQYALRAPEHDFTDGDFESVFESQVAAAIERIAPSLRVRSQVGCEGFRIDLAVCRPNEPDRFLLGIECDGVTYHSEPSARQRDLIRQQVLERHGWRIHRIWSTAWWHNPAQEIAKLEQVLSEVAGPLS